MTDGVKFEATRAAIQRALFALPEGTLDGVLAAVEFDEKCVALKLAELAGNAGNAGNAGPAQ